MTEMRWPVGGGELGELIRRFDWSGTAVGPIDSWPQCLRTSVDIMLSSPVPIVVLWGAHGIMIYNDAYSGFAGKRHPQLLGSKVLEGWSEVADFNRNVMEHGLRGETLSFKDQRLALFRNGASEDVWMDLAYSPVRDQDGKPAGVMAVVVETTGRVKAEEALREANLELAARVREREGWIEQKDLLLREVNHRVKNSLQLVASVLSMQARQVTDPTAHAAFAAASARVNAITSVHERLYKENAPMTVAMGAYLQELCRDLALSVGRRDVSVRVAANDFNLPTEQAVPVALIANELVTNAVLHGSPQGGEIRVEMQSTGDAVDLSIEDAGPGIPEDLAARRRLGMRLVDALVRQIGGSLRIDRDGRGSRVVLHIPGAR